MMPLTSTGGGGDQVKKRTVELWATPLTDWGGDDGAAKKGSGEILEIISLLHLCYCLYIIHTCLKSPKSNRLSCVS